MNRISHKSHGWYPLFLISSLSLFVELAVIRWLSAEIRILAYYKNLVLLAAFLGLSIGFILVGKGHESRNKFPRLWGMFVLLVVLVSSVLAHRSIAFPGTEDEMLWQTASVSFWISLLYFISIILSFFLITVFLFIPLGQMVGEEMALHLPVRAYIVNILASLIGVWIFSIVSFLRTPPVVWFLLSLLGIGGYYAYQHQLTRPTVGIFIATLIVIGIFGKDTLWSPYNRLNLTEFSYTRSTDGKKVILSYLLDVQHAFYQTATDLSPDSILAVRSQNSQGDSQYLIDLAFAYDLPFHLVSSGSSVLVVGAGMGNDIAAALRAGMGHIDAVEIDPLIVDLGRRYHPEHPYADIRVSSIVEDARSFFNTNHSQYDLIVFGLLDSHTLLSGMASVRLDSYVYTLDSFKQVRSLLKKDGYVAITFSTNNWIEERLGRMMSLVFGSNRIFINRNINGTTFIAGDMTLKQQADAQLTGWIPNPAYDSLPLTTDDWPYLYMRTHKIPSGYWQTLLVIALVSIAIIVRSFPEALHPDWHFWLLGTAFLLIEFKTITELALLFGTTWFINSLAISGVLLMALFANLFVLNRPRINLKWIYTFLLASLVMGYFFPLKTFAGLPEVLRGISSTLLLSMPLLFAGIIFSESLRCAGETSRPLSSNFSGSAVGGLLEYGSVLWGIKSLYVFSGLIYIFAFFTWLKSRRTRPQPFR